MLTNIFDSDNVTRIEGVKHNNSIDGCRLAHIKANKNAINNSSLSDNDYYLICEDDLSQLESKQFILKQIYEAIKFDKDLYLFLCANTPEWIKMEKSENPLFYRIYGGAGNAGCYLCKKSFGKELVKFWENNPGKHIDWTWHDLWKKYQVYLSRPNLVVGKAGKSNQNMPDKHDIVDNSGMVIRKKNTWATTPFNFKKWDKINGN